MILKNTHDIVIVVVVVIVIVRHSLLFGYNTEAWHAWLVSIKPPGHNHFLFAFA